MRVIASLLLVLLLITGTASAETTYYVATSSTSYLNVREQPNTDSKIVTTLDRGTALPATGEKSGLWIEVQTESRNITHHSDGTRTESEPLKGWVMISMLSLEQPYSNKTGTITGDGRVRLRTDPDGDFQKWVHPGDSVSVLAVIEINEARWYRIRHGEDRGWVMADYLEIDP
ncbi:SH3 domain-containing protein [Eubacteriales bacterium OttesenSCG-928-A19]|nr:SH3 domain-containing protein [Eubacteriales bacterium OttesenSCG-928-A19]